MDYPSPVIRSRSNQAPSKQRLRGISELTVEQQRDARRIAIRARAELGGTLPASQIVGIAGGTLSTIASGCAKAGAKVYAVLKQWEQRHNAAKEAQGGE